MTACCASESQGLTSHDKDLIELTARISMGLPIPDGLATRLSRGEATVSDCREIVATLERGIGTESPTLSALLAETTKSKCCM